MEKVSESKLAAQKELTQAREEIKKLETEMAEKDGIIQELTKEEMEMTENMEKIKMENTSER